jgi:hypothetical protein
MTNKAIAGLQILFALLDFRYMGRDSRLLTFAEPWHNLYYGNTLTLQHL